MTSLVEKEIEMQVQIHMEKSAPIDHRIVKMVIGEPQKDEKIGIEENISKVVELIEECMGGNIQDGIVICPLYDVVKNREDRVF